MDSRDDEQTRILDGMWNQMKDMQQSLGTKIDQARIDLSARIETRTELSARIDETRTELSARIDATNERLDQSRQELGARIAGTNARLDQTNARLEQTNNRVGEVHREVRALRSATQQGFELALSGSSRRYVELDGRVSRLERHARLHEG